MIEPGRAAGRAAGCPGRRAGNATAAHRSVCCWPGSPGIPRVARLCRVVARLPAGSVLLPGLDLGLSDAAWDGAGRIAPSGRAASLLARLGAARGDVRLWPVAPVSAVPPGRADMLRRALLPGGALAIGRTDGPAENCRDVPARCRRPAGGSASRSPWCCGRALETPGARAALVTPDRELAGRVAAELRPLRHGRRRQRRREADRTPPAVFLRLLATRGRGTGAGAAAGAAEASARRRGARARRRAGRRPRALETGVLRGPRPSPACRACAALDDRRTRRATDARLLDAARKLPRSRCCGPSPPSIAMSPAEALAALIEAAEELAATDDTPGPAGCGRARKVRRSPTRLAAVSAASALLPDQPRAVLPGPARCGAGRRRSCAAAARCGAASGAEHPRIFIWGLLEARLQTVDVMVLGGLVGGRLAAATEPGPWLSRPMRARVGLPSPEEGVGQAAHDFVAAACSAPACVLSCPRRRDGAPAVPARWLTRLEMFLPAGRGAAAAPGRRLGAAAGPAGGRARAGAAARPCPPVALRPRRLSVTEIETWLRDPYAIYARHILRLGALDPLEQATDAADYGSLVHGGLHRFLNGRRELARRSAAALREETHGRSAARSGCGTRCRTGGRLGWSGSPTGSPRPKRERRSGPALAGAGPSCPAPGSAPPGRAASR